MSSWRFIAFLLSNFDDTAVAAIKLVGQSRRNCTYFLSFFFRDCPSGQIWKLIRHKIKPLCVLLWDRWVDLHSTCIYVWDCREHHICWCLVYKKQHASSVQKTLYYKSPLENFGRAEPYTCTATTLHFFFIRCTSVWLLTCYSTWKHRLPPSFYGFWGPHYKGTSSTHVVSVKHDSNPHGSITAIGQITVLFMENPKPVYYVHKICWVC